MLEVIERRGFAVGFPIEVRFVAADDAYLSPANGRDTCYIAVHMYRGMEWDPYFRAVEAIMDAYGGRPHWGKRHFQSAATLAPRYPEWDRFQAVRARLDPDGRVRERVHRPRARSGRRARRAPATAGRLNYKEGLALAAVGRHLVDDLVAGDQVEGVEALAQLARLGVAQVDAVADAQVARPASPSSGVCTSPAPSIGSSCRPGGR